MMTTNQGLSFAEIEQIIAHQVANAIETIAIYETKTHVARDLMNKVDKMAENASNKRKWKGDHGRVKISISPSYLRDYHVAHFAKVMAAPIISISSDSSEESVGSHAPRVILFGDIPAIIPIIPEVPIVPADPIVAPEVGTVSVVSPTGADGESKPAEQRPERHESLTPSSEFPLAPVVAPPGILRPIPARRLAWRRVSHHSSDRHSSQESSSSSSPLDRSLFGHTPPDTTDADTSTPPRFVHRSFTRTLRRSSSERSLDSSTPSSGPSCKRCRSLTASVPSPTHVSRLIAPTHANLLPPRKRFRDSYSPEDSGEEHMEVDTADAEAVADIGCEEFEAEASAVNTREITVDPLAIGDSSESSRGGIPDLEDTIYDIVHHMSEVHIDTITEIETTQRQLETSQLVASGEITSLVKRIGSLRLEYLKEALAAYEATCAANALEDENQSQNGSDGDNGNGGNGNPNENGTSDRQKYQVKYATCTLLNSALTWWNSHKRTIGTEAAFAMSWRELMKLMAEVYCPRNEIQKMEFELWNLTVKNNDLAAYT
ncbi:putative reverse transcriptase domain-containing protein [Tanacetum coccineum]